MAKSKTPKPTITEVFFHHGKWFLFNEDTGVFAVADSASEREEYMGKHFKQMADAGYHVAFHCYNTSGVKAPLSLDLGKSWQQQDKHWPSFPKPKQEPTTAPTSASSEKGKKSKKAKTESAGAESAEVPTVALIPDPATPSKGKKAQTGKAQTGASQGAPSVGYRDFVKSYFAQHAGKGKTMADAAEAWKKAKK